GGSRRDREAARPRGGGSSAPAPAGSRGAREGGEDPSRAPGGRPRRVARGRDPRNRRLPPRRRLDASRGVRRLAPHASAHSPAGNERPPPSVGLSQANPLRRDNRNRPRRARDDDRGGNPPALRKIAG